MTDDRKIGVLGGGQLGRMFLEAANRLNIHVDILDQEGSPAKQISNHPHVTGSFQDHGAVKELASRCDILTVEIEHVDTAALEQVEEEVEVHPSWRTLRTIQVRQSRVSVPVNHFRASS